MKRIKNIKYYIAGVVIGIMSLTSCKENSTPTYSDTVDKINFSSTNELNPYATDESGFIHEVDFSTTYDNQIVVEVALFVQGSAVSYDREVNFKSVDSTEIGAEVEFEPLIIKAGEYRGTAKMKISYPATLESEYISKVFIDYENSDFGVGDKDFQRILIKSYIKFAFETFGIWDGWWEGNNIHYEIGNWSFAKAKFIAINRTDDLNLDSWYNDVFEPSYDWDTMIAAEVAVLKALLEEYKADPNNLPIYDETKLPEKVWISFEPEF